MVYAVGADEALSRRKDDVIIDLNNQLLTGPDFGVMIVLPDALAREVEREYFGAGWVTVRKPSKIEGSVVLSIRFPPPYK